MKTLDEVIETLERCTDYEAECKGCPYYDDNKGGLECEMRNLEEVLHYLKEFQVLSKMWNDKLDKEQANPPLTWDELKTMVGKPVWVEWISGTWKGLHKWVISHGCDDMMMVFTALDVAGASYDGHLWQINLGKTWQAYRKERN